MFMKKAGHTYPVCPASFMCKNIKKLAAFFQENSKSFIVSKSVVNSVPATYSDTP